MKTIQRNVLEAIISAADNIASSDPTRYSLNFVQVTLDDKEYTVEATDGHRLIRRRFLRNAEIDHAPTGIYGVHFDRSKMLKQVLKDASKFSEDVSLGDYGTLFLSKTSGALPEFPNLSMFDKNFALDDRYLEQVETLKKEKIVDNTPLHRISFNAEYLREMLLAMRDHKRNETVTLIISGTTDPILVECDGNKGLLMPVRK